MIPYISEGVNGKVSSIDSEHIVALECFIDLLGITSDSFALACLGITHHQVLETHGYCRSVRRSAKRLGGDPNLIGWTLNIANKERLLCLVVLTACSFRIEFEE